MENVTEFAFNTVKPHECPKGQAKYLFQLCFNMIKLQSGV